MVFYSRINIRVLQINEPKFSTNKGTYFLRPTNRTKVDNLYFAAAYTITDTDMFEMESAAESGKRAAKELEQSVIVIKSPRPHFFAAYRFFDGIFCHLNLYSKYPLLCYCVGLLFSLTYYLGYTTFKLVNKMFKKPIMF